MKKIIHILFAVSFLSLTIVSCQKEYHSTPEPSGNVTPNPTRGHFTCEINGEPFSGELMQYERYDTLGKTIITFYGMKYEYTRRPEDYKMVALNIDFYEGVKEYQIPSRAIGAYNLSTFEDGTKSYYYNVPNPDAKLTITEEGESYKGTFMFDVIPTFGSTDTIRIRNGSFEIPAN